MVTGCGIEEPSIAYLVIALFTLASVALPFVAVAIWRSASNYPRQRPGGKRFSPWAPNYAPRFPGLLAALSVVGLLYLASDFIYAAFA